MTLRKSIATRAGTFTIQCWRRRSNPDTITCAWRFVVQILDHPKSATAPRNIHVLPGSRSQCGADLAVTVQIGPAPFNPETESSR